MNISCSPGIDRNGEAAIKSEPDFGEIFTNFAAKRGTLDDFALL